MVVLLIQEVWRKDDSESSFSENETIERQWNIVYGVGVGLCFLVSVSLIRSFPVTEEWVLLRRDYLQEYRATYPDAKKIPPGVKITFSTTTGMAPTHEQIVREDYTFGHW
mmetsp:Transcript_7941/g.16522  ORF Transcript_7941/g.16522 Transcript_7941/m.16522 type:complete len:110 (-) Transcript_7941:17-346(-)